MTVLACARIYLLRTKTNKMADLQALQDLKPTSKDGKELQPILMAMFKKFQENFVQMFNEMKTEMKELLSSNSVEIKKLNEEVNSLRKEVSNLKGLIDDADSYERRDTLIFSGTKVPNSTNGEDCKRVLQELVKSELKIELQPSDISTAHRLGRKPSTQGDDKRPIVVKLCRRDMKRELVFASKKLPRPASLYVNESLTPNRKTILFSLRQMRRNHPDVVKGCTSIDGRIFAFTKPPEGSRSPRDVRHLINTREALIAFCDEYVKAPLDNFLQNTNF